MRDLRLLRIFFVFFVMPIVCSVTLGQNLEAYQKGLSQYQEKDFEAAAEVF
jgi:hypothetical protein